MPQRVLSVALVALAGAGVAALAAMPVAAAALGGLSVGAGMALGLLRDRPKASPAIADAASGAGVPLGEIAPDLLASLPLGLVLLDRQGRVMFVNPAADAIIERPVVGLMGAAMLRAPALSEAIAAAIGERKRADVEVTLLRAKERVIHAAISPVEAGPEGAAVIILLEDRTRAARAEALRRDFVANASHELRTPLASIAGFIETLQTHGPEDPEAAARFLPIMAAQADRMRRLIDDLLSLTRIEIDEHIQPRSVVDVSETVRETANALQPVAAAAGVALVLSLGEAPVLVRGSHDELSQLFANLIDNAVKYGGDGGRVDIGLDPGAGPRPGLVGISVADHGIGIAREHLPRLTERFYRVSTERSRARGGTGLGLAIAKHILNRHRGELTITSTPGEGARFTVWLPAAAVIATESGRAA